MEIVLPSTTAALTVMSYLAVAVTSPSLYVTVTSLVPAVVMSGSDTLVGVTVLWEPSLYVAVTVPSKVNVSPTVNTVFWPETAMDSRVATGAASPLYLTVTPLMRR